MRGYILFIVVCAAFMFACGGNSAPQTETQTVNINGGLTLTDKTRKRGADVGKIPTSIEINFISGYWHIASGFNVDSIGDFRAYEGIWIDFRENNEFVWGIEDEDKEIGAWGWDEAKQYLYFFSDASKEFFIGEWAANNNGDVVVCVGSTPNNPRSTQFKLVRRHEKIITE